MYCSLDYEE